MAELALFAEESASPTLPLLYLEKIRTQSVAIPDFNDSIVTDPNDKGSERRLKVKRLHFRTILELQFKESKTDPIGIVLDIDTVNKMIKALETSKIEMATTEYYTRKEQAPNGSA